MYEKCVLACCLRVRHRQEAEGRDAVDEPRGRSRPHLSSPHRRRPVWALGVEDDVLRAEGLIGAWLCVVSGGAQRLSHVAVGFGLPAQELTSALPQQLGELIFRRRLKGAE